jgi:negative regulator of sigma-B (phosphoserine phosphatase)
VTGGVAERGEGWVEWAEAGRPLPGQEVNGDRCLRIPLAGRELVAVMDGLGHGPEAAAAAARASATVDGHREAPLDEILSRCHAALARTRGVAMTIASIGADGVMHWVGVGNVEAHVVRLDGTRAYRAASALLLGGVLGFRLPPVRVSTVELLPGDLLLMTTDGIGPDPLDGLAVAEPAERVAAAVVERCARPTDDALVVAGRYRGAE